MEDLARFRNELSLKSFSETTHGTAPGLARVQIVDLAVPALRPSRPNKPLNLLLGTVGGGVAGVFCGALVLLVGTMRGSKHP